MSVEINKFSRQFRQKENVKMTVREHTELNYKENNTYENNIAQFVRKEEEFKIHSLRFQLNMSERNKTVKVKKIEIK